MKPIKLMMLSLASLTALLASYFARGASAFFQGSDGTIGTFVFEPISFLIGIGGGALAVGIPVAASKAAHRKDGRIIGKEQCDDGNDIAQARFGDKRPGVKVVRDMGSSPMLAPGNPIGGLNIKGGKAGIEAATRKTVESGSAGPDKDEPNTEGAGASKPVPGIGVIVKKCPDPNNPRCNPSTK